MSCDRVCLNSGFVSQQQLKTIFPVNLFLTFAVIRIIIMQKGTAPNNMPRNSLLGNNPDSGKWSMFMSCQNLASALSDPSKGKQKDIFTKNWGSSFTEATEIQQSPLLPEVTADLFYTYQRRISRRHRRRKRKSESESAARKNELQNERSLDSLDSVPKIYFQANFSLKNPETFSKVFQLPDLRDSTDGFKHVVRSDRILQEQLSHHLDCVESHLTTQIGKKSESLFSAVTSHDSIMADLGQAVEDIRVVRTRLHQVDDRHVVKPLKVLQLCQSKENHVALLKKLNLIATVYQAQPTIQLQLSSGDYLGALDLISTSQEVLSTELAGINCFKHLSSQLSEITNVIERLLLTDWQRFIATDVNRPIEEVDDYLDTERLSGIVFGYLKLRKSEFVEVYRSEALTSLQAVLKKLSIEAVSNLEMDSSKKDIGQEIPLAESLKKLAFADWIKFMGQATNAMVVLFRRIKVVHDAIEEIISDVTGVPCDVTTTDSESTELGTSSEIILSQADRDRLSTNLRDLIVTFSDTGHEKCAKYLVARTKSGLLERLDSQEFVSLGKLVEDFTDATESVLGRRPTAFRISFQGQASRFVQRFHDERKSKLGHVLDGERWKEAKVTAETQQLVQHIITSGRIEQPRDSPSSASEPTDYIALGADQIYVVGAALYVVPLLVEYCSCAGQLRSAAPELLARLVELLKMFNSRTCQLVLGAGALQLAGLKVISSRTLSIASRSLQMIALLIPRIREHFEPLLGAPHVNQLRHIDQVKVDFSDHVTEIESKLVSLLVDFADGQLAGWDAKPPIPSPAFKAICKQLLKMHESIGPILPSDQRASLTAKFTQNFKERLKRQLSRLNIVNDNSPQHMLVISEFAFYIQNLKSSKLISANDTVENFSRDIWPAR